MKTEYRVVAKESGGLIVTVESGLGKHNHVCLFRPTEFGVQCISGHPSDIAFELAKEIVRESKSVGDGLHR